MEEKLRELISKFLREYMGTGSSGGNATDGNDIPSQRSRWDDDIDEMEFYINKNVYGAEGNHYNKDLEPNVNWNRQKMGMFELKKYIKKVLKEQAYPHATLTTQGQYKSRFTKTGRPPGIMENELADLEARLKQIYREMEQEVEPEGGPIANQYADEIYQYEEAIRIAKGIGGRGKSSQDKSYTEVVLSKLAGPNDAKEYDNEKHQLIIYPDLGSLQYKSRSTQEIVFTHIEGKPAFVRAFGMTRSYDELKKVVPELGEMGSSSYSGFMNVGVDDEPILMDNETAIEMIKAMVRGKEAEAGAQSAYYTRQPGTGGTGIDERLNEQSMQDLARKDLEYDRGKARNAIKRIEIQRQDAIDAAGQGRAQATQAISQQEEQLQELNQQIESKKSEQRKNRNELEESTKRFHEMSKEPEFVEEKTKLLERIYELRDLIQTNKEEMADLRKQRNELNTAKLGAVSAQTSQPSVTKPFDDQLRSAKKALAQIGKGGGGGMEGGIAETLLNQYEKERANVNLMEQMDFYNEVTQGSIQKFFEMFEDGNTNEEVIQHYSQNGIQIPEQFVTKVKKQFEQYKKLKLELGFIEQEAKDFKKSVVPKEKPKQLSSKFKK